MAEKIPVIVNKNGRLPVAAVAKSGLNASNQPKVQTLAVRNSTQRYPGSR